MSTNLVKTISVPAQVRKQTTIARNLFYETIEIYENRVVGKGAQEITWYFKNYVGIDFVNANMNSQFAQIVFLTGVNANNRFTGIDFTANQNSRIMNDTNRILFCSGMFSFGKTNDYAKSVADEIKAAFNKYQEHAEENEHTTVSAISPADELKKFKELLDSGVISQEEFDAKKKQLLGL